MVQFNNVVLSWSKYRRCHPQGVFYTKICEFPPISPVTSETIQDRVIVILSSAMQQELACYLPNSGIADDLE